MSLFLRVWNDCDSLLTLAKMKQKPNYEFRRLKDYSRHFFLFSSFILLSFGKEQTNVTENNETYNENMYFLLFVCCCKFMNKSLCFMWFIVDVSAEIHLNHLFMSVYKAFHSQEELEKAKQKWIIFLCMRSCDASFTAIGSMIKINCCLRFLFLIRNVIFSWKGNKNKIKRSSF